MNKLKKNLKKKNSSSNIFTIENLNLEIKLKLSTYSGSKNLTTPQKR